MFSTYGGSVDIMVVGVIPGLERFSCSARFICLPQAIEPCEVGQYGQYGVFFIYSQYVFLSCSFCVTTTFPLLLIEPPIEVITKMVTLGSAKRQV